MEGPRAPVNHRDVIIVGCGPIGSYAGYRLAEDGFDVLMIDRKSEIGRPIQCAGIVNYSMMGLKGIENLRDDIILKKIHGADIFSPSGEVLPLRGKETKACSIDRQAFDTGLLRMAVRNGASLKLRSVVTKSSLDRSGGGVVEGKSDGDSFRYSAGLIIGADGPYSIIRKDMKFEYPKETIPGVNMEMEISGADVPADKVAVLTGSQTAKGFFSWVIPTYSSNGLRVGLSSTSGKNLRNGMKNILDDARLGEFLGIEKDDLRKIQPITQTFGSVPMGSPKGLVNGPFILLGDSSGMAKGTSGGGIYPGMRAVDLLSETLRENGRITPEGLTQFNDGWNKGYGRELGRTMLLRRIMRDLSDQEMNKAISAFNDEKKLELINNEGDIDKPINLAMKLMKLDPTLLMLVPRYIPYLRKLF